MGDVNERGIVDMMASDYPWEQVIYRIICEQAIDPWDIDLTKLTEAFISSLAKMKHMDFRIPAKYVIIAAVLLKMKADHLDFIEMVKEAMAGPQPEEMEPEMEEPMLEAQPEAPNFDAVRLHERHIHHRKVMFEELVFALRRAMRTEHRKEVRETKGRAEIRIDRVDISKRIKELYDRIDSVLAKLKDDETTFSSVVEEWNRENILKNFIPLMHLDSEKKVDCRQDKPFDEIFIRKMETK